MPSVPTFRKQKHFPEEGIQCQRGAEVQSELGGARSPYWKERFCLTLRSPDKHCAVLVPIPDFRLLIWNMRFWSNPVSLIRALPPPALRRLQAWKDRSCLKGCAELLSSARAHHSRLCCAAPQTRDQLRPFLHQGCFILTS